MKYQVIVLPRAELQLYNAALWWLENRSAEQALRWLEGFEHAISLLADDPLRHPFASENEALHVELRQLNYGLSGKPTHRALFEVRENSNVLVHSIRHLAQDDLSPEEI